MIFNTTLAGGTKAKADGFLLFTSPSQFGIQLLDANWDGRLEWSTDKENWKTVTKEAFYTFGIDFETPNYGDLFAIYLRGSGNTSLGKYDYKGNVPSGRTNFFLEGNSYFDCSGNFYALLDWKIAETGLFPVMGWSCFFSLLSGNKKLRSVPSLSAPTLSPSCYNTMFKGCVRLTSLPKLPASTIPNGAYGNMFEGCTRIVLSETQSDEFPTPYQIPFEGEAETVEDYALASMFDNTGGSFTGTPEPNTTYYLHKNCKIV